MGVLGKQLGRVRSGWAPETRRPHRATYRLPDIAVAGMRQIDADEAENTLGWGWEGTVSALTTRDQSRDDGLPIRQQEDTADAIRE